MLLEHERNHGFGMDALVTVCTTLLWSEHSPNLKVHKPSIFPLASRVAAWSTPQMTAEPSNLFKSPATPRLFINLPPTAPPFPRPLHPGQGLPWAKVSGVAVSQSFSSTHLALVLQSLQSCGASEHQADQSRSWMMGTMMPATLSSLIRSRKAAMQPGLCEFASAAAPQQIQVNSRSLADRQRGI